MKKISSMDKGATAVWKIPREVHFSDHFNLDHLKAFINYNVLFSGPVVISDSDLIISPLFRAAGKVKDKHINGLLDAHLLHIAIREAAGEQVPLGISAAAIHHRNGHSPLIPDDEYGDTPSLDWYASFTDNIHSYSLDNAELRYRRLITKIFRDTDFREEQLPEKVRQAIYEICEERNSNGTPLQWGNFMDYLHGYSPLWADVARRTGTAETEALTYAPFVDAVARGPFVSFLPESLDANPIYSAEDSVGIDIWRGRFNQTKHEIERKEIKSRKLSLADYSQGLAELSVNDLLNLRSSSEFQEFEKKCAQLARGLGSADDARQAFFEYRLLVENAIYDSLKSHKAMELVKEKTSVLQITTSNKYGREINYFLLRCVPIVLTQMGHIVEAAVFQASIPALTKGNGEAGKKVSESAKEHLLNRMDANPDGIRFDSSVLVEKLGKDLCTNIHSCG